MENIKEVYLIKLTEVAVSWILKKKYILKTYIMHNVCKN
jgi:hypothetical protein